VKPGARPRLLLFTARYQYRPKNAVAATLAWVAEDRGSAFDVYYDAIRAGRHYGGGAPGRFGLMRGDDPELGLLTGGLMTGARHLEALAAALLRFEPTVVCAGDVAFANTLAALAEDAGATVVRSEEGDIVGLYDAIFGAWGQSWPETAVMLDAVPSAGLEGIDAYCWPEIFHRRALGVELSARPEELASLREHGVGRILACGLSARRRSELASMGFQVDDLGLAEPGDDYARVTARLAGRWRERRGGWMIGDPVLASSWLPAACRERRAVVYGVPQSRVIDLLKDEIAANVRPEVLGRQFEDADFFALSRLGQSFQLVDPARPPLPSILTLPSRWSPRTPPPDAGDPSDETLLAYAREGRVLTSLVFWTGMIRETENLYALTDLIALTGLRAGLVLTVQSLAYRPSPLDLLAVPRDQGGVFPLVEVLMGSCGTGAAIESLLAPDRLRQHLEDARCELDRLGVPTAWWPRGWWATMDAPLTPLTGRSAAKPVRWNPAAPFRVQVRFHGAPSAFAEAGAGEAAPADQAASGPRSLLGRAHLKEAARRRLRGSRLKGLFSAYRPYENFAPGPLDPELAAAVRDSGFSYMLTKSGFGEPPRVVHRDGDFVALNYTAGQWDGWTPFETVNHVGDLRRAERRLLGRRAPGWLLGSIDACLWAFSGELWSSGPGLAEIARFVASGGSSGRLVNVTPRVIARYARLIEGRDPGVRSGGTASGQASTGNVSSGTGS
jgi:hypothetical protein